MKEKMVPVLLRFVKSARLQRGGSWRAARAGIVAVVVLVWVWVYLIPSPAQTPPSLALDDWSSRFPNLQVAAPISDPRQAAPLLKPAERVERDDRKEVDKTNNEDKMNSVKVENKGNRRGEGGRIIEDEKKKKKKKSKRMKIKEIEEAEETNPRYNRVRGQHQGLGKLEEERLFPKMFPKRRLVLPGESEVVVEEDEDEEEYYEEEEEEEEEGKWKGRNMDENDAMEEMDEVAEVDDDNNSNNKNGNGQGNNNNNGNKNIVKDKNNNNNNDFVQEEVGKEAMKRKRQRRDRQQKETENGNNGRQNAINLQNALKDDLTENGKPGHRSQQKGNDLPDLDLVAVEEEMRERRSRVRQVCARYGLGPHAPPGATQKVKYPPTPAYETFYIDRGDRLAWCPVYKAASTSWLYGFLGLAGISESYVKNTKEQVSTVARRVWPELPYDEAKEALNTCVKAIVVRHPFERLASAFRDKLEKVAGGEAHGTGHFYQKYGRNIVEKYRKKDDTQRNEGNVDHQKNRGSYQKNSGAVPPPLRYSNALDEQPPPQPPPPLRYSNALDGHDPHQPPPPPPPRYKHVLDDAHQPPPPPPPPPPPQRYKHILVDEPLTPPPPQPPPQSKEPTFSEFVRYLVDTDLTLYSDDHWTPYHLSCTPCLLDFDVIAKFETLDRDQAFLLRKTNLLGKLRFSWRHLTKGNRTKDVVKKYFAQVPKRDLLSLYSKYRLDFEMFDYSVDEYLTYVVN